MVPDQLRSSVRCKGRKGGAQSSGPAAEPWPREKGGQRSSGQGKQSSERRAAPRKGKGGAEETATAAAAPPVPRLRRGSRSGPPGQQEVVVSHLDAGPAAEEEAAVSQEILKKFFCQWDDAHFRDRVPALLPGGWQQLTNRQIKRLVGKWRKTQHVWKFTEQGSFRNYVLARLPESVFGKLPDGQKEGYWQTFKYGGPKPDGADGSDTPEESRDRETRTGILRSRSRKAAPSPRGRSGSSHRRIAGLSDDEDR